MSEFQIKKAQRLGVKLKILLAGPSGSGKTKGALWLARSFVGPQGRICVIDTERESASFYAGEVGIGEFDTIALGAPYHTDRFIDAIGAVVAARYDFCIVDSITHQWSGVGGVLERKEQMDARGGNNFTNWAKFTPETEKFRNALLEADVHLLATVRSKQEYVVADEGGGRKSKVQKMGMKPEQREGLEYEFGIGWQLQMDNRAEALKDRTGLFSGQLVDLRDPKTAFALRRWVESGAPDVAGEQRRVERAEATDAIRQAERPVAAPARAMGQCQLCEREDSLEGGLCGTCLQSVAAEKALLDAKKLPLKGKAESWGYKGIAYGTKPIGDCPTPVLKQAAHFFKGLDESDPKPWIRPQLDAISLVLADREAQDGQASLEFPSAVNDGAPESATAEAATSTQHASTPSSTTGASEATAADVSASESAAAVAEPVPQTIGALSRRISELLLHEKFTEADRAQFRAKLDTASTIEEMQSIVGQLEHLIDLPF